MTFEFISLLPLAVSAAGGGAAPVTGFASVTGAGISETESALNRLTQHVARVTSEMSEKSSEFSESRKHSPVTTRPPRLTRSALKKQIFKEAQERIEALIGHRLPGETVEAALHRAATRTGLSFAEVKGIRYGDKRKIDGDVLEILRRCTPAYSDPSRPDQQNEIAKLKEILQSALARLDEIEREPA